MAVFNFYEVEEVPDLSEDPRRPLPRIENPRKQGPVFGSMLAHVSMLALLLLIEPKEKHAPQPEPLQERRAFFLPKELSRPAPPRTAQAPKPTPPPLAAPTPPPPPPPKSAKISIGEASDKRLEEIRLERDRDIGRRGAKVPQERAEPEAAVPESQRQAGQGRGEDADHSGLRLPQAPTGNMRPADDPRVNGPSGGILSASTRSVERAMRERKDLSQVEIPGYQMGPLFFDPEGADFTRWINHFKGEVYRNWIIPEPALLGIQGKVEIDFTVERDGKVSRITLVSGSGTAALDRAASNALQASLLLPLPQEYPRASVTIRVIFSYTRN